jgi:tetratricopeptide (TPR) repeat protein
MRWIILFFMAGLLPANAQSPGGEASNAPISGADRKAAIDHMLDALKAAPSEEAAAPLEAHITDLWMQSGSPAVSLLMARGLRELNAQTPADAVEDLGAAITLDPDFAEAYDQRAIARFAAGDTAGAIEDLHAALQREPRDFGAFRTLSEIAESREDWKSAYAAWQQFMAIDPKTPGGEEKLKDLRRRALGDET